MRYVGIRGENENRKKLLPCKPHEISVCIHSHTQTPNPQHTHANHAVHTPYNIHTTRHTKHTNETPCTQTHTPHTACTHATHTHTRIQTQHTHTDSETHTNRPDQTRPDQTRPDQTRPDQTRPDQTRPDQTRPDQTRPDQTRPDQTRPDQTRPDQTRTNAPRQSHCRLRRAPCPNDMVSSRGLLLRWWDIRVRVHPAQSLSVCTKTSLGRSRASQKVCTRKPMHGSRCQALQRQRLCVELLGWWLFCLGVGRTPSQSPRPRACLAWRWSTSHSYPSSVLRRTRLRDTLLVRLVGPIFP